MTITAPARAKRATPSPAAPKPRKAAAPEPKRASGMIAPGGMIGIVGGGQLGRMLAMAATSLGYRTAIYAPEESGPARDVATRWVRGGYEDGEALARFAQDIDVATYEFENVPVAAMERLAGSVTLHPPLTALAISQDRDEEKRFLRNDIFGGRGGVARWRAVDDRAGLDDAIGRIGLPAVLKTRRFGYDGKGQARLATAGDADAAWSAIGEAPAVLEARVEFAHEFSILAVRGRHGAFLCWDASENVHEDGILRHSRVPAAAQVLAQAAAAREATRRIADALDYVGVLAVEFFATSAGPLVNEIAPRVHNSGHWTIEGAVTSQFENHIRAICGLPLGSTALIANGAEMTNLIGADVDAWAEHLADPAAKLHLYGKREARPGRKMGHVTRVRR